MKTTRVSLTYFLIHAVVANLYYHDMLGDSFKGSNADKISNELQIIINFVVITIVQVNGFLFTLFALGPALLIAMVVQILSICSDG